MSYIYGLTNGRATDGLAAAWLTAGPMTMQGDTSGLLDYYNTDKVKYRGFQIVVPIKSPNATSSVSSLILTYILSCTVSKLLRIISLLTGVPLFNSFVQGEPINLRILHLASQN